MQAVKALDNGRIHAADFIFSEELFSSRPFTIISELVLFLTLAPGDAVISPAADASWH